MPLIYLRKLTARERSSARNRHLGMILAMVAGAMNAGGFLAVGYYTSHMTGLVSAVADDIALGQLGLMGAALTALLAFIGGAACSALLINWARRRQALSEFALPLLFEAVLLLLFGLLGSRIDDHRLILIPATVGLLCFIMGLQNAMITKISRAEIRTTHVTGLVTDIGIELGRLLYWNMHDAELKQLPVRADRSRLRLLASLLGMFFGGGVLGALAFKQLGYIASLPLALILLSLAVLPIWDDLRNHWRN